MTYPGEFRPKSSHSTRKRGPDRTKRRRRTREQIAADRLEALLGKCGRIPASLSTSQFALSDLSDHTSGDQSPSSTRSSLSALSDARTVASVEAVDDRGNISSSSSDHSDDSLAPGSLRQKLRLHFSERKPSDGASSSDAGSRMNIADLLNHETSDIEDESLGHRSVTPEPSR